MRNSEKTVGQSNILIHFLFFLSFQTRNINGYTHEVVWNFKKSDVHVPFNTKITSTRNLFVKFRKTNHHLRRNGQAEQRRKLCNCNEIGDGFHYLTRVYIYPFWLIHDTGIYFAFIIFYCLCFCNLHLYFNTICKYLYLVGWSNE